MRTFLPGLLVCATVLATPAVGRALQPATHVVVSEVFYGRDSDTEWVELHNPTASAVIIDDWTLDDGDNEGRWRLAPTHPRANYGIAPGGSVVIAQKAGTFFDNHCQLPDFALIVGATGVVPIEPVTTDPFLLNNTDDQVLLRDDTGVLVDGVGWGCQQASGSSPCGTDSTALDYPIDAASSSSTNYRSAIRTDPSQEGDEAAGETSEILPLAVSDACNDAGCPPAVGGGLWTHVRATSLTGGVSNCDPDTSTWGHAGPTSGGLILFPYVDTLTLPSAPAGSGSVEIIVQGKAFQDGATVELSGSGIEVRSQQWISSEAIRIVIDIRTTAAPGLRDVTVLQPDGFGDTAAGAFEVLPHVVVPGTTVVISELLVAPTGGGTAGEWVELHNPTGSFAVLDGWWLTDGTSTWTFPDPVVGQDDLILIPGGSVVVATDADVFATDYGTDPDLALLPGATGAWPVAESGGSFELLDTDGRVYLYDAVGLLVDAVAWGTNQPPTDAMTHPLYFSPAAGETLLRVERADTGDEQGGPLNEELVEAFETSDVVPTADVSDLGEGPETGGLQAIPIIDSVTPATVEQGEQDVTVVILGRNFVPASTVSISDTGITYDSVTWVSATEMQAVIDVDPTAPISLRDVTVTNPGGYSGTRPGGLRVILPVPLILSATPNSVFQGDTSVTFTLTGVNTHFTAGDSQVLLGDGTGYAVESLSVIDLTTLEVTVSFQLTAAPGFWDARVSTSAWSESATGAGLIEVRALPRVETCTPAQGNQGDTLDVTVVGVYTDFTAAAPVVDFGPDIAVNSVSVIDAVTLVANVSIGDFAALGLRPVTVTVGPLVAPSPILPFEVLPRPAVKTVTPASAFQGDTLYLTLEGLNTSWLSGVSTADFGADTTVLSLTVNGPASAVAQVQVDAAAAVGVRDVTVTTGTEIATLVGGFDVVGKPRVTQVTPASVQQGESGVVLTLDGVYTRWDSTSTVTFSDTGLTVVGQSVSSSTSMTVTVDVAGNAPLGLRDVLVTTGTEAALATAGLRVTALSYISAVSPSRATQGQTLSVEVVGANTAFQAGVTAVDLGAGVTVSAVTVTSPTRLIADVTIDQAAALGARDVTATTASQVAVGTALFNVDPFPYVAAVSPGTAVQGTVVDLRIVGVETHFDTGSFVSFGGGVAVAALSVIDDTNLDVTIAVSTDATPGIRDVTVYTGTELAAGAGLFEIIQKPTLISVTPDAAATGDSVDVVVVGEATHFQDGVTVASFGAGIGVTAVTVQSETQLTASLVVSGKAASGMRDVTVTTGGEEVVLLDGFEVLLRPRLRRINPAAATQGDILLVEVEGQGTTFQDGAVTLDLGPGITIIDLSVAGTLRFVAEISVAADAPPGNRDVVVDSGGTVYTLTGAFLVRPLAQVTDVSPAFGRREDALTVSLTGANTAWGPGTGAVFGDGIAVTDVRCSDATHCDADLTIDALARLGSRDVTLFSGTDTAFGLAAFEVLPKAEIATVFPERATQGQSLVVTVIVAGALIAAGDAAVSLGAGVSVTSVDLAADSRTATLQVEVDPSAAPGPRPVSVETSDAGTLTLEDGFRIDGRASILSATPPSIPQGGTVEVTLVGDRTSFQDGISIVDFGDGTAIAEVRVESSELLVARVRASPSAELGPRDVVVTTGTEVAVGLGLAAVVEPSDDGGDPNAGAAGCSCAATSSGAGLAWWLVGAAGLLRLRRRYLSPSERT